MTMPRWRLATWTFLLFNVVMVGLVLAVGGIADSQTSPGGGFVVAMLGMTAVLIIWPIGLIIIGIAWLVGRGRRENDPVAPKDAVAASQASTEASKPLPPPPMMRTRPSRTHMRSDTVTPRASADFLSRRATGEETGDDAPDADDLAP